MEFVPGWQALEKTFPLFPEHWRKPHRFPGAKDNNALVTERKNTQKSNFFSANFFFPFIYSVLI